MEKKHPSTRIIYRMLGLVLGGVLACTLGQTATPTLSLPSPTASGPVLILFTADRTQIAPGECVQLHWQVDAPQTFFVQFEGEGVPAEGSRQVCPPASQRFMLGVDLGDRMEWRTLVIEVIPPSEAEATPTTPPLTPTSFPNTPPSTSRPGPPPTSTPLPSPTTPSGGSTPGGGNIAVPTLPSGGPPDFSGGSLSPDFTLAADLSLDRLDMNAQKQVIATVTNQGPGDVTNISLELHCTQEETWTWMGVPLSNTVTHRQVVLSFSLLAGLSTQMDTGLAVNPNANQTRIECTLVWGDDADLSNNTATLKWP